MMNKEMDHPDTVSRNQALYIIQSWNTGGILKLMIDRLIFRI